MLSCNEQPDIPHGWEVVSHDTTLQRVWLEDIVLYTPSVLSDHELVLLRDIEAELEEQEANLLNATVLDKLLAKPEMIPADWMGFRVLFLGTKFLGANGHEAIRFLLYDDYGWGAGRIETGNKIGGDNIAIAVAYDTLGLEL